MHHLFLPRRPVGHLCASRSKDRFTPAVIAGIGEIRATEKTGPATVSQSPRATSSTTARLLFGLVLTLLLPDLLLAQDRREIAIQRTPEGVRFGIIRHENTQTPAPTLLIFAHAVEEMQKQPVYTEVAAILAPKGWVSIIVDPPCHGEDIRNGEPPQLQGWCHRLEQQEDFIAAFTTKASSVLDYLIQQKIANPDRIAACGTSRGGFLAYHFAAADKRVKAAGGVSPVTRLTALREFSATSQRERAESLNLSHLGPKLSNTSIWLSIGNNDARVNTDDAITFTRAIVHAAAQPEIPDKVIPVELIVAPAKGHSKIDLAHERLADWLLKMVP